jgi:hypothetical protein
MSLIITKGFGEEDGMIEYVPVPICKPEVTTHEWGKKRMITSELGKKSMKVEPCIVVISECEEQD